MSLASNTLKDLFLTGKIPFKVFQGKISQVPIPREAQNL